MFLQVSVCSQGADTPRQTHLPGRQTPPVGRHPLAVRHPSWAYTPSQADTPPQQMATATDGTHPTGMHSRFFIVYYLALNAGFKAEAVFPIMN